MAEIIPFELEPDNAGERKSTAFHLPRESHSLCP